MLTTISLRSNIVLSSTPSLPERLFPVDLPITILKVLLSSSILGTGPANLNLTDLVTLNSTQEFTGPVSPAIGKSGRT